MHAAAKRRGGWTALDALRQVNVDGSRTVLQAARSAGVPRLVLLSTEQVVLGDRPLVARGRVLAVPGPVRGGVRGDEGRGRAAGAGGEHAGAGDRRGPAAAGLGPRRHRRAAPRWPPRSGPAGCAGSTAARTSPRPRTCATRSRACWPRPTAAAAAQAYFVTDGAPVPFREFATALLATRGIVPEIGTVSGRVARAAAGGTGALWRALPPARPAAGRPGHGPGGRRGVHAAGRPGPAGAGLRGARRPRAGTGRATVGVQPGHGRAARLAPGGVSSTRGDP